MRPVIRIKLKIMMFNIQLNNLKTPRFFMMHKRNHIMRVFFSVLFLLIATICFSQSEPNLKLWYKTPSGNTWENALPIGNGRLGAMIYGNTEKETIQLNEHTVWSGSPNRNDNPLALDSLAIIRQLIFEGKQKDAERIAGRVIITKKSHGQKFEPVGSLQLAFDGHENVSNY
jgi:alpha-L-fucosidase 2